MAKSLMIPDYKYKRVWEIKIEFLKELKINCLIIDIDNTLALADDMNPQKGVNEWIYTLQENGIKIIFLSNNTKSRVKPFAKIYDVPCVHMALKPLPFKFNKAISLFDSEKKCIAMIGDQIFTDVVGGNFCGITTILVEPFEPKSEGGVFFRFKRRLERRYITRFETLQKESDENKNEEI